ncbi:MAG: lysostaphin resistance A-like protein [Mucilaginibacter sp.]
MTDTVNIPPYKEMEPGSSSMHPGLQFLLLAAILIVALIIGTFAGLGIVLALYGIDTMKAITTVNTAVPHFASALWVVQFAGTTFPILATPVFFAYVVMNDKANYLRTNFRFPPQLLIIVFAIMLCAFPVIELLSNINQKIPVPHFLQWMADNQKTEQKLMDAMMNMKGVWDAIYDVLFIGLLTAIVEEFLFRGCIQTIFARWTKNIHVAIWVTAIFFSAFHLDFFGFLPRVLLGAMFGYFVAWSGSIWTSVWAHFINNGTIVVVTYLYQVNHTRVSPDDNHVFNSLAYIISAVIILFLFWVYRRMTLQQKPLLQ